MLAGRNAPFYSIPPALDLEGAPNEAGKLPLCSAGIEGRQGGVDWVQQGCEIGSTGIH